MILLTMLVLLYMYLLYTIPDIVYKDYFNNLDTLYLTEPI